MARDAALAAHPQLLVLPAIGRMPSMRRLRRKSFRDKSGQRDQSQFACCDAGSSCDCRNSFRQCILDRRAYRCRNRWRKRITNLPVSRRLATPQAPVVRDSLDACDHSHREAWHAFECLLRHIIGNAQAIDTEFGPCLARARWAKVGAAVFLRAANDGGGDPVGAVPPFIRMPPPALRHKVMQCRTNGFRFNALFRPAKLR